MGMAEPRHLLHQATGSGVPAGTPTSPCPSSCPGVLRSRATAGVLEQAELGQLWGPPQVGLGQPAQCPAPRVLVSRCTRRVAAPSWHAAAVACFHARELHRFRARS